jgi:hypothetical protein
LDGAFFRGEPVVLSYPEETQLSLRAGFFRESEEFYAGFGKLEVRLEWRGEAFRKDISSIRRRNFVCDDPIGSMLRHKMRVASYDSTRSPAMRLFLRELSQRDNVLEALGNREFHRKVLREVALEALASF